MHLDYMACLGMEPMTSTLGDRHYTQLSSNSQIYYCINYVNCVKQFDMHLFY